MRYTLLDNKRRVKVPSLNVDSPIQSPLYIPLDASDPAPGLGKFWNGTEYVDYVPPPQLIVTPEELSKRIGVDKLCQIQLFVDGGVPPGHAGPGSPAERSLAKCYWGYGKGMSEIDLGSQLALDMFNALRDVNLFSQSEVDTITSGGSLV